MSLSFTPLGVVFSAPGEASARAHAAELSAAAHLSELEPHDALLAWWLARLGGAPDEPHAHELGLETLALALLSAKREGSTYVPLEARALRALLEALPVSPARTTAALRCAKWLHAHFGDGPGAPGDAPLVAGPPGARTPLIVDGARLYMERQHALERRCAEALAARLADPREPYATAEVSAALADVCARPAHARGQPMVLTASQRKAVEAAVKQRMCVVSGGPGTGKTTIVVSVLRVLARLGVAANELALAAPTGKAAQRMTDAVKQALDALAAPSREDLALREAAPAAMTLHRLLRFSPTTERFLHHAGNPIAARVVVIDEASMLDLGLMDRLLRALRPDATLLLLGDADQLPSIEAGAVLRDLAPSVAVRLRESHRMDPRDPAGRAIFSFAERVREGRADALASTGQADLFTAADSVQTRARADDLTFTHVELLEAPAERAPLCARHFAVHLRGDDELARLRRDALPATLLHAADDEVTQLVRGALERCSRSRVLCVTRDDVQRVNAALHAHAAAERLAATTVASRHGGADAFANAPIGPGEPVLVLANDYERGLWNGDQGVTLTLDGRAGSTPYVAFPSGAGLALHPLAALRGKLELAYASTVHKSQGSEMDQVILWLPLSPHPLCTRELVYTAITRARRSVVIAGPRAVLLHALAHPVARRTALAERLQHAREPHLEVPGTESRAP